MKLRLALVVIIILMFGSGCSVYMAAKQPDEKDVSVFNKGTPRKYVIAECGEPVFTTEKEDGSKSDIFVFVQGYSTGEKTSRAIFHGAADFFTLGLWEVLGTPIESAADGTEVKVEVEYDANELVSRINVLEGEEKLGETDSFKEQFESQDVADQPDILPENNPNSTAVSLSLAKVNPDEPWTGIWEVESSGQYGRGIWGLEQRGASVVSTEDSIFDDLNGNIKGMQLKGKIIFSNSKYSYPFTIKISPDGQSFVGKLIDWSNKTEWLTGKRKK